VLYQMMHCDRVFKNIYCGALLKYKRTDAPNFSSK